MDDGSVKLIVLVFLLLVLVFTPAILFWTIEVLFGHTIPLNMTTWFAGLTFLVLIRGGTTATRK